MNSPADTQAFELAKEVTLTLLRKEQHPTPELIKEKVALAAQIAASGASVDVDALFEEILDAFKYSMGTSRALDDPTGHVPWLPDKKADIQWKFWDRYRSYLLHDAPLPPLVVRGIDDDTGDVLERLENPERPGAWDRRGLVVGSVQSGKTGNYTGLICKAMDAGYKLVIILAGMHNSLRSQTQLRTDEGVTGFDTSKNQFYNQGNVWVGVGLPLATRFLRIASLTTSEPKGDFKRSVLKNASISLGGDPYILIVKKNKAVLENLLEWVLDKNAAESQDGVALHEGDPKKLVRNVPFLLIDDEADIASINTKASKRTVAEERTAINAGIIRLLKAFEKKCYVGYTATPFANIFIDPDDPDDVFPRSFILNLEAPENYVGAARVFGLDADPDADITGREPLPLVKTVSDHEPYFPAIYDKNHDPGGLPDSMREAIRAFILVCAARRARGQIAKHNSMLIHVARFINVQGKLRDLVADELISLQRRIEYGDGNGPSLREELRELWEREFRPKTLSMNLPDCLPLAWEQVECELHRAASKIAIKEINGEAQDVLDYVEYKKDGRSVIAIGGDKLSRGLTLEGLSVSYYLRVTKMYDSLMQMGRWFGYRDGYLDLCRLYTTKELQEWYRYIALADLELRREFKAMWQARRTPRDYGLRVRTHPDGMLITALNKSRFTTKVRLSYTGELVQTAYLDKTKSVIKENLAHTESFLKVLDALGSNVRVGSETGTKRDARLWRQVPGDRVATFLRGFVVHPRAFQADGQRLAGYIENQRASELGDLSDWTVALISTTTAKMRRDIGSQENIGLVQRDPQKDDLGAEDPSVYCLRQRNIITPSDQHLDFEGQILTVEMRDKILSKSIFGGEAMEEERRIIREHQGKPLVDLALALSRWRAERSKTGSGAKVTEISNRIVRELRPDSQGLLLLYPLDPEGRTGITNIDLEVVQEKVPIMGFAVSFPVSERARPIEYQVNEIYKAAERAAQSFDPDAVEALSDE